MISNIKKLIFQRSLLIINNTNNYIKLSLKNDLSLNSQLKKQLLNYLFNNHSQKMCNESLKFN